jgi:hypothetical protein
MAIANSDGSIILSTKVDTSGMEQGTKSLKSQAAKLAAEYRKAGMSQSEALKKAWSEIERTRKETEKATKSTQTYGEKAKTAFQGVGSALKSLAGYLALAFSVTKIIQFSNESASLATQTEASVRRLVDIYGAASDSVGDFIDANARALGMSKSAAASFSSVYGNLFSVWADQATNAQLTNEYLQMTAVVASKTGRTVEDVQERVRSGLLGNTEAIEDLGIFVNVKTIEMTDAFQRMANGKSWEQLDAYTQQQIRSMAILEQATAKYGDEVADTSATIRNRFNAAYQDFQNSWGNIVNTVLLPVLETLTQIFDIATKGLNALSGRSGQILENVELQEENTDKTAENIEEQVKNQKDLNKEMKKTLAGFDEIQILSSSSSTSGINGTDVLDQLGIGASAEEFDGASYVQEVDETLSAIMGIVALSLVAVGLILLFTGASISYGIGFIIAGAGTLGVTMAAVAGTDVGNDVIQMLLTIMAVASGALLAIGIILCFLLGPSPVTVGLIVAGGALLVGTMGALIGLNPNDIATWLSVITGIAGGAMLALGVILCMVGSIPVGVGLIIAGAVSLASAVALNSDAVVEAIRGPIGIITAIVSGALLVLGIILTCSGILPLGIGLIAAGAIGLASVVAINWNAIIEAIRGPIGAITAIVSGALLVLGIILVCTGVGIPLGIGLILAGAAGLATVVAVNWDAIWDAITGAFNAVTDWVKTYGLLVLGILLCLTGAGFPIGLALLIKWAKDGAEKGVPLAETIVDKVKGAWEAVKQFWNTNIAPIFTAQWWLDLGKTCINGLISGFESGINGIIWAFESMINWIVDGLNKISFDLPDWLGGGSFGINLPRADFGRVSIPRLAQGAVIPPNREFLAVLGDQKQGTNIEAPLQTIVDAFNIALAQNGNAGGNTEVVLEIDGREFGRAVVEQGNRENRRIGTRLVIA